MGGGRASVNDSAIGWFVTVYIVTTWNSCRNCRMGRSPQNMRFLFATQSMIEIVPTIQTNAPKHRKPRLFFCVQPLVDLLRLASIIEIKIKNSGRFVKIRCFENTLFWQNVQPVVDVVQFISQKLNLVSRFQRKLLSGVQFQRIILLMVDSAWFVS